MRASFFGGPLDGMTKDVHGTAVVITWKCCSYAAPEEVTYYIMAAAPWHPSLGSSRPVLLMTPWVQPECSHHFSP